MSETSLRNWKGLESLYRDVGEYLARYGEVLTAPLGGSMRPLLKGGGCQVVLVLPKKPLKRLDVVLYRGKAGKLVLHRIVRVRGNELITCGDNTYCLETGIRSKDILGVMAGFYRGDAYVPVTDWRYRYYSRFWWFIYPLRKVMWKIYRNLQNR